MFTNLQESVNTFFVGNGGEAGKIRGYDEVNIVIVDGDGLDVSADDLLLSLWRSISYSNQTNVPV